MKNFNDFMSGVMNHFLVEKDFVDLLQKLENKSLDEVDQILLQHKNNLTAIHRNEEHLFSALLAIDHHAPKLSLNTHQLVCAVFEHAPSSPWPPKKAQRFVDLLTQIVSWSTNNLPQGHSSNGNAIIPMSMFKNRSTGNKDPAFPQALVNIVPSIAPIAHPTDPFKTNPHTLLMIEKLVGQYAANYEFSYIPSLCRLWEGNAEVAHRSFHRLNKRKEDHPQWQEAVSLLSPLALAFEDRQALQQAVDNYVVLPAKSPKM